MLINLKKVLMTVNGDTFKNPPKDEKSPPTDFTLLDACVQSLSFDFGPGKITGVQKYLQYKLCEKLNMHPEDQIELDGNEIVFLKEILGVVLPPQVSGQAWDILDGKLL